MTKHVTVINPDDLTFGQRAVGLNFNPSGDLKVNRLKEIFAEAIDIVANTDSHPSLLADEFDTMALHQIVLAQMAAVKSVTFKD